MYLMYIYIHTYPSKTLKNYDTGHYDTGPCAKGLSIFLSRSRYGDLEFHFFCVGFNYVQKSDGIRLTEDC